MSCTYTLTLNPSMDLFVTTELVEADKKIRSSGLIKHPGGGGINASRVIQRLGGSTRAIFPVGGFSGNELLSLLEKEKIQFTSVKADFDIRTSFSAFEESTGRIFRFVPEGPLLAPEVLRDILNTIRDSLSEGDLFLMSGSIPSGVGKSFFLELKGAVQEKGATFVIDTSKDSLLWAVESGVDILRVNHEEALFLKNHLPDLSGRSDEELGAFILKSGAAKVFICTTGAEGAKWFEAGKSIRAVPPKVKVLSSVGAGDSFVAGLLYGLSMKFPSQEILTWAVACAAATVISPGTELCQREDVFRIRRDVEVKPS